MGVGDQTDMKDTVIYKIICKNDWLGRAAYKFLRRMMIHMAMQNQTSQFTRITQTRTTSLSNLFRMFFSAVAGAIHQKRFNRWFLAAQPAESITSCLPSFGCE